jgi:hypothetical protein
MNVKRHIVGFRNIEDSRNDQKVERNFSADILNKVIEMAKRGKTMREIAEFIDPDNVIQLMHAFNDKNSELHEAFQMGVASMGPDIKLLSAQAEIENIYLQRQRGADILISDYLGEES